MKRKFWMVLSVVGLFALASACGDDSTGSNNNNPSVCNNDGVCDGAAGETAANCGDCVVSCDMTISGTDYDFLVKELFVPDDSASARQNGVDVDGDGEVDNKLGSILSLAASQGGSFDVNTSVNDSIAEGKLLLIGRVHVDQFGDDEEMFAQVFQGEVTSDGTPDFSGLDDKVAISQGSPTDLFLCGSIASDNMTVGPSDLAMVFPVPEVGNLNVTLSKAQMIGTVKESGWTDVLIGGAISKQNIDQLFEQLAPWLNSKVQEDPSGSFATTALDLLDKEGSCATTVDGCDPLPAGCVEDGEISVDELKCNTLLATALKPDVDLDGDGEDDAISLGLKVVEATPVTVVQQ